jgi:hypothetical protein
MFLRTRTSLLLAESTRPKEADAGSATRRVDASSERFCGERRQAFLRLRIEFVENVRSAAAHVR